MDSDHPCAPPRSDPRRSPGTPGHVSQGNGRREPLTIACRSSLSLACLHEGSRHLHERLNYFLLLLRVFVFLTSNARRPRHAVSTRRPCASTTRQYSPSSSSNLTRVPAASFPSG